VLSFLNLHDWLKEDFPPEAFVAFYQALKPSTFALGDQDRAKYEAIGEADNFVLKFRKPTQ
jgi:predicted methyltransferase